MLKGEFDSFPFLVIGHRGDPLRSIENTIPSFQRAVKAGVHAVEFDVRLSKDEKVFVFHDDTLGRLTIGEGLFKNWDASDLNRVRFRNRPEGLSFAEIPTLEQVLKKFGKKLLFYIELKVRGYSKKQKMVLAEKTMKMVKKNGLIMRSILVSFDYEIVKWIKQKDARFLTGLNFDRVRDLGRPEKDGFRFLDCLCSRASCLQRRLVKIAQCHALDILAWVVNDLKTFRKARSLKIRGIATDDPEKIMRWFFSSESKISRCKARRY